MKKLSKKHNSVVDMAVNTGANAYQASVMKRAVNRAGHCPNLKGHVYEILTVDKINFSIHNRLVGRKAFLTKSTTAIRDDVVVKQGGRVVARMQLKDTPNSIYSTIKKVEQQQYRGTSLVGTNETVKAYKAAVSQLNQKGKNITQQMTTNNISSVETEIIAKQALGASVKSSVKGIAKVANKSACTSAAISAGIKAVSTTVEVVRGHKNWKDGVCETVKESVTSYASVGVGQAVSMAITMALAMTPLAPISKLAGAVGGMGVSYGTEKIVGGVWK